MKTTKKEVIEKIQEHILEFFETEKDFLIEFENKNTYSNFIEFVQNGGGLVYYSDVSNFLNELGINPKNKTYTDIQSWELYKHLFAREAKKIYKKLTK